MLRIMVIAWLGFLSLCFAGGPARAQEKTVTTGLGMEFVLIPAGTFVMGTADEVSEDLLGLTSAFDGRDERPPHEVTLSAPYYLGKFEVTQEQWAAVMPGNSSKFKGRKRPVDSVSWNDIQVFIRKLNEREKSGSYRLPTEAEWEYAARAGTKTLYFWGDDQAKLGEYAWFEGNSKGSSHPVGEKKPNPWGLFDMNGNVGEWVADWYGLYFPDADIDPTGPGQPWPTANPKEVTDIQPMGSERLYRGGYWGAHPVYCRSATRWYKKPGVREPALGFRLVFSPN